MSIRAEHTTEARRHGERRERRDPREKRESFGW
jgi:hypothetical protein